MARKTTVGPSTPRQSSCPAGTGTPKPMPRQTSSTSRPEPAPAGRRSRAGSAHRCRSGCPSRSRTTWPRSLGPRDVRRRRSPDRPSPSTWTATAAPDPNRPAGELRPSSPNRHLCELGDLGYELGPRRPPHRPSRPYPSARACYPGVKVARLHVWRAGTTRARRGFGPRIDTVPGCWSAIYATSWTCPTTRRARRRLAEHLGSIVRAGTAGDVGPAWQTALRCRRRPGRRTCPGRMSWPARPMG